MPSGFERVAPYLQDPLVLAGFAIFLFFSFCRYLLKREIIPQLSGSQGYKVVQAILLYGFVIGLAIILLGFGLKYRDLSKAEQGRAVGLLNTELDVNLQKVSELAANLESVLGVYQAVEKALRDKRIPVLAALFPEANLTRSLNDPPPADVAKGALLDIAARGLDKNKLELDRADAAGKAIVATIQRTRVTLKSLADPTHQRYAFRDEAYQAQLEILRRIAVLDLTGIQTEYEALARVRNNYDAVVVHVQEYLDAVDGLFGPADADVNAVSLTKALTAERMALVTLAAYTPDLVAATDRLRALAERIRATRTAG